jgi:hypothetical protein
VLVNLNPKMELGGRGVAKSKSKIVGVTIVESGTNLTLAFLWATTTILTNCEVNSKLMIVIFRVIIFIKILLFLYPQAPFFHPSSPVSLTPLYAKDFTDMAIP